MYEFLKITKDHIAPDFSLRLPGMSRSLVIHQLSVVYWRYRQSFQSLSGHKADAWYERRVFQALQQFNENVFNELGEPVEGDQINDITVAMRKLVTDKKRNRKRRVQPAKHSVSGASKRAMSKSTVEHISDTSSSSEDFEDIDSFSVEDDPRDGIGYKRPTRAISSAAKSVVVDDRSPHCEAPSSDRLRDKFWLAYIPSL